MKSQFNKRQLLTLIVISVAEFATSTCISLQAPFYPQEINCIGSKLLFNGGIFTTGTCVILFGFLDRISGHYQFIISSYVIRIIEGLGSAAIFTASSAIIANEFPNNVAVTFSYVKTFFGLGLIVGPTVGGALYQLNGYTTPFAVLGSGLFLVAIITAFVLPRSHNDENSHNTGGNFADAIKIPGVAIAVASIVATSISIGFISVALEPHLRQFNLKPLALGLMFIVKGGIYAVTAPVWGKICDKITNPKVVTIIGCLLITCGFSLIGPAPFVPYPTTIELIICGLLLSGLGSGAQLIASFTDAIKIFIHYGYPNNLETYGLVGGLWASSFALGAFFGPSIGGFLIDIAGFKNASIFIITLHLLMGIVIITFIACHNNVDRTDLEKSFRVPLIESTRNTSSPETFNDSYGSLD